MTTTLDPPQTAPLAVVLQARPDQIVGYACALCHLFYPTRPFSTEAGALDVATRCCQRTCAKCDARLAKEWHYTYCQKHLTEDRQATHQKRLDKAQKIPEAEYTGPVYCEDNETYYESTQDLRDSFDDEGLPSVVWACTTDTLEVRADDVIESALQDHHEDARDWLVKGAEKALQVALDNWIETYGKRVETWNSDYSRLIVLAPEEPSEPAEPTEVPT